MDFFSFWDGKFYMVLPIATVLLIGWILWKAREDKLEKIIGIVLGTCYWIVMAVVIFKGEFTFIALLYYFLVLPVSGIVSVVCIIAIAINKSLKKKWMRKTVTLIVATCITVVLVGGLLILLNASH